MPVTSSKYPSVQNTELQPVPWNPVTPNNLKAGFLAFPVWFKILTVVFDYWMICWYRFTFHCYKHYPSWSFTAELFLLVFHHWITPLGLFHCWITTVAPSLLNYPSGLLHLNYPYWSFITEWFGTSVVCVPREKKGLVHRVSSVWHCVWSDRYLTNCYFGALTTYARRARLSNSSKSGLWAICI